MLSSSQRTAWANAYLQQARSDWEIFKLLQNEDVHACHPLHYLQMATEKLSKALLLQTSQMTLEKANTSHKELTQLMRFAKRNPRFHTRYPIIMQVEFLDIVDEIERLAPSLAKNRGGSNPEYPWEDNSASVTYPSSYSFWVAGELKTSRGRQLLYLIKRLLEDDTLPF